ncbi:hypothetical protein RhiirC2_816677 [Rhizophagus irregularis]|uniref:Hsp70 family protein n=1 Tax=Rhizophagus irregularis TaxID=588596 RepID=A0A2N1MIN1_9GLOM|nr:hypothetical protein RhiirC2_816677 [Rhizophagus irregularis]
MTNECSNSENLFPADNQHEIAEKLEIELNEKNQEISRTNLELNKKNQEILRNNSNLIKENENVLRINNDLKEKLQKIDEQFENLQQDLNLEKQKNKEIQRLEIVSQNLEKNLKILEVDEIDINTINAFKENIEQENCNIDNSPTTFALNDSKSLEKDIVKHIWIVVGLDFGITYSGFSYCHVSDKQNIISNEMWPGIVGLFKTNTVLQYDDEYKNVLCWGAEALRVRPTRKNRKQNSEPVKLFKLCLGDSPSNLKPKLPINYENAITDYLLAIGKFIKETINRIWPGIDYFEDVLLVLTIPAESSEAITIYTQENCNLLQSVTEATTLYCIKNELKYEMGETFIIVDCGKYTIDLTTRKLVKNDPLQLGKFTAHIRDFCGSRLINEEFIKFLRERLGTCAIDKLVENNYDQLQYMAEYIHHRVIEPFTNNDVKYRYELDIEEVAPTLLQYVSEEAREIMEERSWLIEIKYNDVKKMIDTLIDRIIRLINIQFLNNKENCSTIFLTGDFCVNKYLQNRIKEEFSHHVNNISVPACPEAAVARGAVIYGLSMISISTILDDTEFDGLEPDISSKVLKYTYGIQYNRKSGDDITHNGKNCKFKTLVKRGTVITPEQIFSFNFKPESNQTRLSFAIYYTRKYNIEYCDELEMKLLGILNIDLSDVHLDNGSINFELTFGQYEIIASARNENRQEHMTTFCYPDDDF